MKFRSKLLPLIAVAAAAGIALSGCSGTTGEDAANAGTVGAGSEVSWPRTITHEDGETVIPSQPKKIVSTSLSVTGTLLAIEAPVVSSAATNPSDVTDSQGFFSQWADVAKERNVGVLYPNLEFDLESVVAAAPDLIVVSTSGADSTADHYKELSAIAPTIVVNYGGNSWQDLALELGKATGHEADADAVIGKYDAHVKDVAAKIKLPAGESNIISYNGPGQDNGVAKLTGTHAKVLDSLGFKIADVPEGLDTSDQARQDFAFISFENLTKAAMGNTVFLLAADDSVVKAFEGEKVLANLPSVKSEQVVAMGPTSFRLDYYSSIQLVDLLGATFS
ncbi:Fe2+-enterobactin ABC transporter substrate-binding protein [Arthrobacter antibioticus]|uniref:Fe2+-enterobactin ABC transporter substrate-binding protein n=1 Tax=Arthrobacter sp. H35-MC1 TaxID=3046203 RepID=UPI0024BB2449|nr:Fe2+-enterobactin ABC transporter substrate-binding protein [Arthrobacter sp. H35-MC1]MDJ0318317.1 Fe2+-enterobactin ABC transporter substrate-binding protein [Arthrobacter sp. H35-MC1]